MSKKFDFGSAIKPKKLDDLMGTTQVEDSTSTGGIQQVQIKELHEFKDHPFKVLDNEDMEKLIESVKENGIITPLTVRADVAGGYEIVSGHRRKHAAELAGLNEVPVYVVEIDDDTAILQMVDSNLQRETILPSEKAFAYKMKMDALSHQGRASGTKYSIEQISDGSDDSPSQIKRYIRLTYLLSGLLDMVDNGSIKLAPAYDLSFCSTEDQQILLDYMTEHSIKSVSMDQAKSIRGYSESEDEEVSEALVESILNPVIVKPRIYKISLKDDDVKSFFKKEKSEKEMKDIILLALKEYRERHGEEE